MKKILVRVPQWLGDAVLSTVFLSQLKKREREAEIWVLCLPFLAPIFDKHPDVSGVIELPYKNGGTVFDAARDLRTHRFDESYILPKSFRTALETWLAGVPRRVGFQGDMQRFLLTEAHKRFDKRGFDPYRYLSLLGEREADATAEFPFFPKDEPSPGEMEKILGQPLNTLKRPILGVAPKSVAPARTWAPERFAEVANLFLSETGGSIFLFGIESERSTTAKVKSLLRGSVLDFTGRLNMPGATGSLGWVMSLCGAFMCNDSGLMHIAIALGVPTLAVYGSGDPGYAGYHKKGKFEAVQHKEIFCVPCLRNHCVRIGSSYNECLKAVTADEVMAGLRRLGGWR